MAGVNLSAGCFEGTPATAAAMAKGAFSGRVEASWTVRDAEGLLWTHSILSVKEAVFGTFGETVEIRQRGGWLDGVVQVDSRSRSLSVGERAFFLVQQEKGFATLVPGLGVLGIEASSTRTTVSQHLGGRTDGADWRAFASRFRTQREVTESGLSGDPGNTARFTAPDRGQRIPVVYDARVLPPGMTKAQAVAALENALAAWESASSARFRVEGEETFDRAPNRMDRDDGKLYVQLGDPFNEINDAALTLGVGGRFSSFPTDGSGNPFLGSGGTVAGRAFHHTDFGFVVLDHTKETMANATDFAEVLTHEIGHALGLSHSSETLGETEPSVAEATMYFRAHRDGRGAAIRAWDAEKVRLIHPLENTPPFGFDRLWTQLTAPVDLSETTLNDIQLLVGDLQGDSLTVEFVNRVENTGTFELRSGNVLRLRTSLNFGDADAGGNSFYNRAFLRVSDGVNASPLFEVVVRSIRRDSDRDGLPDAWVAQYFGGSPPNPQGDASGDGITNLQAFRWGLNPFEAYPALEFAGFDGEGLDFTGVAGVPYALEVGSDLVTWSPRNWVIGTGEPQRLETLPTAAERRFLRVRPVAD